jgi:FAD binding domain
MWWGAGLAIDLLCWVFSRCSPVEAYLVALAIVGVYTGQFVCAGPLVLLVLQSRAWSATALLVGATSVICAYNHSVTFHSRVAFVDSILLASVVPLLAHRLTMRFLRRADLWMPMTRDCLTIGDRGGLSGARVGAIVTPGNARELSGAIAARAGRNVAIRGAGHSMGGQTFAPDVLLIDCSNLRDMCLTAYDSRVVCNGFLMDPEASTMTSNPIAEEVVLEVGAGAHWTEVIRFLNEYALSVDTLQSYANFSVGGTVSVNGHGIVSNHAISASVVAMDVALATGELVHCCRAHRPDLFRGVIGGLGLLGVIASVRLRVVPNVQLRMRTSPPVPVRDFAAAFVAVRECDAKLARIDVASFDSVTVSWYQRVSPQDEIVYSALRPRPPELSVPARLCWKWLAGAALGDASALLARAATRASDGRAVYRRRIRDAQFAHLRGHALDRPDRQFLCVGGTRRHICVGGDVCARIAHHGVAEAFPGAYAPARRVGRGAADQCHTALGPAIYGRDVELRTGYDGSCVCSVFPDTAHSARRRTAARGDV